MTRAEVVEAAMLLAAAGGIEALTIRGVARRLEVTPMALYNHVKDKADLVDAVAREAAALASEGVDDVESAARSLNELLASSPWLVAVFSSAGVDPHAVSDGDVALWRRVRAFTLGVGAMRASGQLSHDEADEAFEVGLRALLAPGRA